MSAATALRLAAIGNGRAIRAGAVPRLSLDELPRGDPDGAAARAARRGAASAPPAPERDGVELCRRPRRRRQSAPRRRPDARSSGDSFPSLTPDCPQVHLFEREIAEQFGLQPDGHPWLKPVRFHRSYRPGRDAWDGRPASRR